jgi:hypothetical protein
MKIVIILPCFVKICHDFTSFAKIVTYATNENFEKNLPNSQNVRETLDYFRDFVFREAPDTSFVKNLLMYWTVLYKKFYVLTKLNRTTFRPMITMSYKCSS